MSDHHFMSHTLRMERAGIYSLWVSLGSDKDHKRLMHVSPDSSVPRDLAAKFPTRTFLIDGTDPVLRDLIDDMIYAEGGATAEKVQAAIDAHPLQAEDLREFYADWVRNEPLTDEDLSAEPGVTAAEVMRSEQYIKGLLRGNQIIRKVDAKRA